jgi:hypothetical protein
MIEHHRGVIAIMTTFYTPVSNEAAVQPAAHIEEARTIELITIRGRLD